MSLVELITQADEPSLAASGLACLDRCLPLLGSDAGDDEVLRPLWASLAAGGTDWAERLTAARGVLDAGEPDAAGGEAAQLVRRMLDAAPSEASGGAWRGWADACSVASLQVHRMLDAADDGDGAPCVTARREGRSEPMSPLADAELRRQTKILQLLAAGGPTGLRQALDVSTEGRRVLRAAVSRRARSGA
ncbi:hypothetical protein [Streptomyces beihaiensis]|uniref:HEAT repeat domain-containing protein n=1 Tax=Streptomyces beihaiensis TaxID=2984495 RepID=A0ABT3TPN5_9ACTN|nr:hypothetical protein [Streptomyces beihaiensis]MCX3059000.1 hypothetical protein [Streptomyces beihaiensis]